MKKNITILLIFLTVSLFGQEKLTLEACYVLVSKNYPIAHQKTLLEKQHSLDLETIKTGKLPQINFSTQATYQSDVTQVPISIPNATIEPPNKDQYKATISATQLIYNSGLIDAALLTKSAELKTQQKQVEVKLYQQKKRVNQYYFSILLLQEKQQLLIAKKEQLNSKLQEVNAGIKYGVLLSTSNKILEAELLKIEQQLVEMSINKITLINSLSLLIGNEITSSIIFENPTLFTTTSTQINRPELDLFQLQKESIETSEQFLLKQNAPKLIGFATGGYGNPGLNMLDNSFQTYYHIGVQLNWTIFDWNSNKKQRESLLINKDIVTTETEQFNLNTALELGQQKAEIEKLSQLITSDKSIIELRKEILKSAESQLKNGVITSSVYITELTNLYEDENSLKTHTIELLLAKANYNLTQGN